MWFEKLTGFKEESPDQVRSNIEINGNVLTSKINGLSYQFGNLSVVSLAELKLQLPPLDSFASKIQVEEVIGNIQSFHKEESNNGAFLSTNNGVSWNAINNGISSNTSIKSITICGNSIFAINEGNLIKSTKL